MFRILKINNFAHRDQILNHAKGSRSALKMRTRFPWNSTLEVPRRPLARALTPEQEVPVYRPPLDKQAKRNDIAGEVVEDGEDDDSDSSSNIFYLSTRPRSDWHVSGPGDRHGLVCV